MRAVFLVLLFSSVALGIAKGGTLYIKSKDTPLLRAPKAGSPSVATLQIGDEVIWLGPSEKDKVFHLVEAGGKKGFVLMSNLSPSKPQRELVEGVGKTLSREAFVNSGASVSCPPVAKQYRGADWNSDAAAELIYIEELNKAKATPAAIQKKDMELRSAAPLK